MIRRIQNTGGSILLQVLVSLFILSMGLMGTATLILSAIESNTMNKNRYIATNLAQEGIEVVRNLRDTNWLTYSSDLRVCWNFWDDTNEDGVVDDSDEDCEEDVVGRPGQNDHPWGCTTEGGGDCTQSYFIVDFDPTTYRWNLVPENRFDDITDDPEYNDGNETYRLYQKEENGATFFTHDRSGNATATNYYRKIYLFYIDEPAFDDSDSDPTEDINGGTFDGTTKSLDNRILVISKVYWYYRGTERDVTISTIMTDYYDRHEWES